VYRLESCMNRRLFSLPRCAIKVCFYMHAADQGLLDDVHSVSPTGMLIYINANI